MTLARIQTGWLAGLIVVALATTVPGHAAAQHTTKVPSSLRYGSGLIDVPVASVLPHLAVTATYSGFWASVDNNVAVDGDGNIVGGADPVDDFFSDGAIAIGLFDRLEVGATFQAFNDAEDGGTMAGAFGRLAILRPEDQGIGLGVGARWVSAPDFEDNVDYAPGRLGFPDRRLRQEYLTKEDMDTEFTPYVVGSAFLRGFDTDWLPQHDVTITGGWGDGMFTDGEELEFYRFADSEGWFAGGALHVLLTEGSLLNLMGEWNGFDLNFGAQLDWGGIRVGGFALGTNYFEEVSEYRDIKYGILASVAICPDGGLLCRPALLDRAAPDTVVETVTRTERVTVVDTVEVAPPLPTGTPTQICLATGQSVQVLVTAQGDTLVGPNRVSIRSLRPGVVFAGTYAEGREWFEQDENITYNNGRYSKTGGPITLQCPDIQRVGEYQGVSLFARRGEATPYQTLYVPVRPGIWQPYQRNVQGTRGDIGGGMPDWSRIR